MTLLPLIFICYLAYLALARYKHHLGVAGWAGVEDSLDELGGIRKATLDFGGEKYDKIFVLWGLRMHSFRVVAYTTLKVRL
jgi:hypothetical protein